MSDPILKKAMEKRDEALREAERWEGWIKAYVELADPAEDLLDIPMGHRTSPQPPEGVDLASSLRASLASSEKGNGHGFWPRSEEAKQ
jgi:hypothetical protein